MTKLLCTALMLALIGCNPEKQWHLHEITGHLPDLHFALLDDTGQPVTDQSYQGYLVMLFFGFTNCQSECPATLFQLANVVRRLGDHANRTRILFVTLDPGHDTPEVLHRYLTAFDTGHAVGLTGNDGEVEDIAKRYRAAYRPKKSDSDSIVHSAAVYIFDPQGHARLLMTPNDSAETVADDLQLLLDSVRS